MKSFLQRFGGNLLGVLPGFDRMRYRGTCRFLTTAAGMMQGLIGVLKAVEAGWWKWTSGSSSTRWVKPGCGPFSGSAYGMGRVTPDR